ncbi:MULTISPECIES: type II toxin-antitoxin system RelE/ParE family toxin [Flavobacteriaceae]|jgi:plasmid stabilization system protein ParE|uniref:Plasmid stabilization system protein n=1 Tax=Arenibacter algicola TaxID=616991 RepID=A0A221V489_9FLAO|nr:MULTISPECIES: type II toxin-antitoxin system RelE/ParE family toxin [Flavobacteriaceae]ASO08383.1 plasmid stabilization system protein [Arenibacter algicola]USD27006.1 type II toxin-antitoxin system RelE/ParE family toxin [Allomuricauda aquimarina]|tara:strand:- start:565 stop:870 length:306 start_codon:yes stop_codon:yes gene_type:complete
MTYRFQILEAADHDIAEAILQYEKVRKGLSVDFELCLEEGYADILNTPLGYQVRYREVRIKFIRRFPYGIHYMVEDDMITVISVFHQSRSPRKWFKRLGEK